MRARASDPGGLVALDWVAPDGCPDAAHVELEVERLLADVSVAGGPYLEADAQVRQDQTGVWNVELRTRGRQGPGLRRVSAESCRALADATALILALAIDPDRVARDRAAEQPPAPPRALAPAQPTPPHEPTSRPALRFAASGAALVDVGTLPTPAPGVAATLAASPRALPFLRTEVGARLFRNEAAASPATRSGTFSLRTFDAGGCVITPAVRLEIGACATGELAWVSARGLSESAIYSGNAAWLVLRARATLAYSWSSAWAIRADAGGGLNVSRPEFLSAGAQPGVIHRVARYDGRSALGIELRF
jgi:hypothetical protein